MYKLYIYLPDEITDDWAVASIIRAKTEDEALEKAVKKYGINQGGRHWRDYPQKGLGAEFYFQVKVR
jgi:hypothetical protein